MEGGRKVDKKRMKTESIHEKRRICVLLWRNGERKFDLREGFEGWNFDLVACLRRKKFY